MRDDAGSVSLEAAIASAALLVFSAGLIGALATFGAYIAAIDTAGAAARSHAIGVAYTPQRGSVEVVEQGEAISVTATMKAPFGSVHATATYPKETW